jgi:hypothetical protein
MKSISIPRCGITPVLLVLFAAGAVSAEAQGNKKGYRYAVNRYPAYGQRVASPPFGIRVNILPSGYFPFYTGGYPYYYSNGVFYRTVNRTRDYEVIEAPVGAEVPSLPSEARTMVIDGEKFYSVNGTYFKDAVKTNGELWYRVVGRNGVLNTNKQPDIYAQQQYPQQTYPQQQYPQQAPQSYPQQQYPQQAPQSYPQQPVPQQQYPQQVPQSYPQQPVPQQQYPQQVPQSYPQQPVPQQQYPQQAPQSYPQQPVPQQQPPQEPQREIIQQPQQVQPNGTPGETTYPAQPVVSVPQSNGGVREAVRRSSQSQPGQPQEPAYDSIEYTAPDLILHDNPGVGWIVDKLPENCKTITISNKKYFLAPNGIYYEEYIDQKRQIRYKVAGKEKMD